MIFSPPNKLLLDNKINLVREVLAIYMKLLATKHRVTTSYHPHINSKVENLNGLISSILTKMLTNKPTIL
jgi:hypothetical protein